MTSFKLDRSIFKMHHTRDGSNNYHYWKSLSFEEDCGSNFRETFKRSQMIEVGNVFVRLIHYQDLVKAKMSSGRSKDHDDLENLREGK